MATRAVDKKYPKTVSPPEPLVQIQNNFTQMFFRRPSDEIAKPLCSAEQNSHQS